MTFNSKNPGPMAFRNEAGNPPSLLDRLKAWKRRLMSNIVMDHQAWWDMTADEFRFNRLTGMRYN